MDSSNTRHETPRWLAAHILRSTAGVTMPVEIINMILDNIYPPPTLPAVKYAAFPKVRTADRMPYFTPPANGRCPLMSLPAELRRTIFADSLPSKHDLIHPRCDNEENRASSHSPGFLGRNRTTDLMTLNKQIKEEIAEVIYEERTFVIRVHEGLRHGGIEFLNAGRQPLHYQDSISDGRFWKFSDKEEEFGFRRLKKIRVQIFPSLEESCQHAALNTYFMSLALVRLLERNCAKKKDRITNLTIEFMKTKANGNEQGRAAIQRAEHYWWDPNKDKPRETSIHGLPNIELVLRPFANLTDCHAVNIEMPDHIHNYARIAVFVRDLKASMKSSYGTTFADDDLERKIESARWAMEEHVYSMKYGVNHRRVEDLSETEAQEGTLQRMDLDSDAEDSGIGRPNKKRELSPGKPELSPGIKASSPGSESKRSKTEEKMAAWRRVADGDRDKRIESSEYYGSIDDDEALARGIEESERFADRPEDEDDEEKQIQKAIEASMAEQMGAKKSKRQAGLDAAPSSGAAFVGQGRTLGGIQHTPGDTLSPTMNRYLHNSAAPWNGDASPELRSYYKRKIAGRNSNTLTLSDSGQPSAQSASTHPAISPAPQDEAVSLPNGPQSTRPHPQVSPGPRDPEDLSSRSSGFHGADLSPWERVLSPVPLNNTETNITQGEEDDADHTDGGREPLSPPRRSPAKHKGNGAGMS